MSMPVTRRALFAGAAAAAVGAAVVPFVRSAAAEVLPNGLLAFTVAGEDSIYKANPDGTQKTHYFFDYGENTGTAWSPDGTRIAYCQSTNTPNTDGIYLRRAEDPFHNVRLTDNLVDTDLTFSPDGRYVFFSRNGVLRWAAVDGSIEDTAGVFHGATSVDRHPTLSYSGPLLFDRSTSGGAPGVFKYVSAVTATQIVASAMDPEYSPDGTKIVYIKVSGSAPYTAGQVWTANIDGTSPVRLGTADLASDPTWSPNGEYVYFTDHPSPSVVNVVRIKISNGVVNPIATNAAYPALQPLGQNSVVRTWGQYALDTAIAISRSQWADHNEVVPSRKKADVVVLSRSDGYWDALVGSALAAQKNGPLLITWDLSVYCLAEIQRVLAPGGKVYILGGTNAVPQGHQNQLAGLGYVVERLAGINMFDTALLIDQEITATPSTVIIATGLDFYDALAAGAAAGANPGTVIVLSYGDYLLSSAAAYLDSIDPTTTTIVVAGGPGENALSNAYFSGQLPSWPSPDEVLYVDLVGVNAMDTALKVARAFFTAPQSVAFATTTTWYDALTGGAMIGNNYGPLLLTQPSSLYPQVADYLNENSANIATAYILGGEASLPAPLVSQIGDQISLVGQWQYSSITPSTPFSTLKPKLPVIHPTAATVPVSVPAGLVHAPRKTLSPR